MKEDWAECRFEDLLDYEQPTKYLVNSTKYNDDYKIPVLTAGKSFIKGYTNETEGIFNDLPTIIFDDFTTASQFVTFEFKVKSSAMKILVPTSDLVDIKFIFYYMQANRIRNDTHKRYWISVYAKKKLHLPPLLEQRAIVAKIEQLFSDLDNGIANLKKAQEQLKIYRQAVLKKAFEGELTNVNMTWVTLGEVCKNVEYGTSSKSQKEGKLPVLRMGNIQNGKFDWNNLVYTNDPNDINKYLLNKNDVLFNRTNSPEWVGKTAIFKGKMKAIFAGYLIRINYDRKQINGDYLNYFMNCHIAKKHGNKVKSFGVNQSNINGTKLKNYPFPLIPLQEQHQIVQEIESRLSVCDKVEETIKENLLKAEALRQSILKKAFEGKLLSEEELKTCRQEADWQPAGKLLAQIREERTLSS